jgi:DnaJ-class molecular chaperone
MDALIQLGLPTDATKDEVKQAWRRLAKLHHPDAGGDATTFHQLRLAYETAYRLAPTERDPTPCPDCRGRGKVQEPQGFRTVTRLCKTCRGSGVQKD